MQERATAQRPSRWRRSFALAVGAVTVVVGVALFVLPRWLPVERFRGRVERSLGQATGWSAELGELRLSVWRGLALTARPARLASPDGESWIDIGAIDVRAALLPLLRGELDIRTVLVREPAIRIVRLDAQRGWSLPVPVVATEPPAASPSGGGLAVSIDEVRLVGGRLEVEDRLPSPPRRVELSDVEATLSLASGKTTGRARLAGGEGRAAWDGHLGGSLRVDLANLAAESLAPWIGEGLVRDGRIGGRVDLDPRSRAVVARLQGEHVRLVEGTEPLERVTVDLEIGLDEGRWLLRRMELEAAGARVSGAGILSPDLALDLRLPPTDLAAAQSLARALFPLPLELAPPGQAEVFARIEQPRGGELIYTARGTLAAASFAPGGFVPDVRDARVTFQLTPQGELDLSGIEGTVAGGRLAGSARLDRVFPPGTLALDAEVAGGALGEMLAGLVESARGIGGEATLACDVRLALSSGSLDASALAGGIEIEASDLSVAGWDLEAAIRRGIEEKLQALAAVAARRDADETEPSEGATAPRVQKLLDRVSLGVGFDRLPWDVRRVVLRAGAVSADGTGTFDPRSGAIDLQMNARLDEAATAELVGRHGEIRSLVGADGRLELALGLRGPLVGPTIELDLGELIRGAGEQKVKDLIRGLFDRKKRSDGAN